MTSDRDVGLTNGAAPAAVSAAGVTKEYMLGEHRSLQLTARRLLRRSTPQVGPFTALSDVSFSIHRGDALGVVGTNGSGKSTLLQLLAGVTLPTKGRMTIRGRVLPLLVVGTGFHPELTGRENVTLFASSLGVPRDVIQSGMDAVSEYSELERHMDTPLKRYSSGMVSRLCFAIAMQFPADIYLFDEVLAVVDGEFQARCLESIKRLHAQGRTVIFVSHSLDQVKEVCQNVLWLESGQVRAHGSATTTLDAYALAHEGVEA
jgi:ABC-type polysaccharide/polyol phosphate transport system ATPase subunit